MATTSTTVKDTKKFVLGHEYASTIFEKAAQNAVIPALIPQTPQLYVDKEALFMTEKPLPEYVGEGGGKNLGNWDHDKKPMYKFKIQSTVRMTEEVEWADEDNSLDLLDMVINAQNESLFLGVDAGMIHQWNPLAAAKLASAAGVAIATNAPKINMTTDMIADVDSLPDKIIEAGYVPNGIALDTLYANALRKVRNPKTGAKEYPDIKMNLELGNFEGMTSVTSGNVSGRSVKGLGDTGLRSIIGDWTMAEWGVIRDLAMRRFDVGDPDGTGRDLAHYNEVAYRLEMVFAFGIWDMDAFSTYWDTSVIDDDGGDDGGDGGDDGGDTPSVQSTKASK